MRNRFLPFNPSFMFLLFALAVAFPAAGAGPAPVSKTVLNNLPEKKIFGAAAVRGAIYAFEFAEDDTGGPELTTGGHVYAYDPKSAKWQSRAPMPVKKANFSLVEAGHRIFIFGGMTAPDTPTASVEEYIPAADKWVKRASMPTARGRMSTVVLDGRIYAIGGKIGPNLMTDAVEAYDPVTDTWSVRSKLSAPMMGVSTATLGGKIYRLKGTQVTDGRWNMVCDLQAYDPAADSWTTLAAWPFQLEPIETVVVGSRLYAVGGGAFAPPGVRALREYDFKSGKWVVRGNMPEPAAHTIHFTYTVLGGKIYTFGGGYRDGDAWKSSGLALRYDPAADEWEKLPPLSAPKIGAAVVTIGNRIFVLGGEKMGAMGQSNKSEFSDSIEIYEVRDISAAAVMER